MSTRLGDWIRRQCRVLYRTLKTKYQIQGCAQRGNRLDVQQSELDADRGRHAAMVAYSRSLGYFRAVSIIA